MGHRLLCGFQRRFKLIRDRFRTHRTRNRICVQTSGTARKEQVFDFAARQLFKSKKICIVEVFRLTATGAP